MRFAPHMDIALAEARAAFARAETPVGAVIVDPAHDRIVARAGNRTRELPTRPPMPRCWRSAPPAPSSGPSASTGLDIYVTLEPCAMCAAAIAAARLARLCYGAADRKSGGVEHGARVFVHAQTHHRPEVYRRHRRTRVLGADARLLRRTAVGSRDGYPPSAAACRSHSSAGSAPSRRAPARRYQ